MIDLIEDIRNSIVNDESYVLVAGLLKEDMEDASKLIYSGEALLHHYTLDEKAKQLIFKIESSKTELTLKELLPFLLILGMDKMLYELKIDVNEQYSNMEVVGFGKNDTT